MASIGASQANNLTCAEQGGYICLNNEYCPGNDLIASDSARCCNVQCETPQQCGDCKLLGLSCDRIECNNISEGCYFVNRSTPPNDCNSCAGAVCSDYGNDSTSCTADVCGIGNCIWNGGCVKENVCGNGIVDSGEECDGIYFGVYGTGRCADYNSSYLEGNLSCTSDCKINVTYCISCTDNDKDGFNIDNGSCGIIDCNDNNSNINPNASEICDGMDNDCDNLIDEGLVCGSMPNSPSGLVAQLNSNNVSLVWIDNSNNEDNFIIERSIDGGNWQEIGRMGADVAHWEDLGILL